MFLKIHQHLETLKEVKKLESWLYQLTRNAIIDSYRSTKPTTTLEGPEMLRLPAALPDDDVVSELFPCVRAMVRSLPEPDRQALVLTEYQGLTQQELAERLGLSFSGAKSRVQRARGSSRCSWHAAILRWIVAAESLTTSRTVTVVRPGLAVQTHKRSR